MATGRFLNSNTLSLYSALRPVNDFALRAAQKDQELQYLSYLEENQRQQTQSRQQQIQQAEQWKSSIAALPFEAPDRERLKVWANQKKKELSNKLETQYGGKIEAFLEAEGATISQNILTDLVSSDLYNIASKNKENVAIARKAVADGKNLTGGLDPKTGLYKTGEVLLQEYQSGVNPVYNFGGAYDPTKIREVSEYFAKQDNPYGSKYENTFVPEVEKLSRAKAVLGGAQGEDAYYRDLIGRPLNYKRYSIEDEEEYLRGIQKDAAALANTKANTARTYQSMKLAANKDAREQAEFEGQSGGSGNSYITEVANLPNLVTRTYAYDPQATDVKRDMKTFGRNFGLQNMVSTDVLGNQRLNFYELAAPVGKNLISQAAGTSGKESKVGEVILPTKGGAVFDLTGINHRIVSTQDNVFYMDENTYADRNKRDKAFQKLTIEVDKKGAAKMGLLNDGIIFDNVTRLGTEAEGVRRSEDGGYIIDVLKGFQYTPILDKEVNKYLKGQKGANEVNYQQSAADFF